MKSQAISSKIQDDRKEASYPNYREDNGRFRSFVVLQDPNAIFTSGISTFGALDMECNLRQGVFADGTVFKVDDCKAIVVNGKLLYLDGSEVPLRETRA